MPVSAGIYNALMQPVKSVADYAADYDQADIRKQGIQRNALMMKQAEGEIADRERARQQALDKQNALMAITNSGAPPENVEAALLSNPLLYSEGNQRREDRLKAAELAAKTKKADLEAGDMARIQAVRQAAAFNTPEDAIAHLNSEVASGKIPMQSAVAFQRMIQSDPQWQIKLMMAALSPDKAAELLKPVLVSEDQGGTRLFGSRNPLTGALTQNASVPITQSANNAATVAATIRGQNLTDARARENNEIQRAAQRTQIVDTPNGPMLVDKGTAQGRPVIAGDGKAVPGENAMKRESGAKRVLSLLDQAEKLIPDATGSYAGAAADTAARVVGAAPSGAQAIAKLKALEGSLLAEMPRMEGPQSNADVQMYKQAAGELGDPTAPRANKLAALETIREIQSRYAGVQVPAKPREGGATGTFDDPEKERRYQEWKRKQGL